MATDQSTEEQANGSLDTTKQPARILVDGEWRDATPEEVEASWKAMEQDLLDGIDERDDLVQYTYETFGANSPEYQAVKIKDRNGTA